MKLSINSIFLATLVSNLATGFVHPGILYTTEDVERFSANALSGEEPWATTYQDLLDSTLVSPSYVMQGPFPIIGRGSGNSTIDDWSASFESDTTALSLNALVYAITKNISYAETVASIVDAWASTLTSVVAADNILTSLGGRDFVNGAELVRYLSGSWPSGEANFIAAQTFISEVLVPHKDAAIAGDFSAIGGNQAWLGHMAGLEFAIFTDNVTGYATELDILTQPELACEGTMGSGMQALILNTTGQCAEAGRDQGHSADEVGWMEEGSKVASNQGNFTLLDLPSQDGKGTPLLLLALEYFTQYNTGNNVTSFDATFSPCCCLGPWPIISNASRGEKNPLGEIGYAYYHDQKGFDMPFTTLWLETMRPLELGANLRDFAGWQTLTWANEVV